MVDQNAQLVAGANILTLALSTIGWVSMVSGQACFTVKAGGEVTTLLAHAAVHTRAVAIALACWETKEQLWILIFFLQILMSEMTQLKT